MSQRCFYLYSSFSFRRGDIGCRVDRQGENKKIIKTENLQTENFDDNFSFTVSKKKTIFQTLYTPGYIFSLVEGNGTI